MTGMLDLILLLSLGLPASFTLDYCPSQTSSPKPTMIQPNKPAPFFKGQALVGTEFKEISLSDYQELIAFSERIEEFRSLGCEVVACSTDSVYSHLAWTKMDRKMGGLGEMKIPLLSDKTLSISRAYGVLDEDEGHAFRGLFLIDKKGILRQMTVNDRPVGRSVNEALRLLKAFQFHEAHGDVCPVNWEPDSKTMKPNPVDAKTYFSSTY